MNQSKSMYDILGNIISKPNMWAMGFLTMFSRTSISKQFDNYPLPTVFFWQTWLGFALTFVELINKQTTPISQATFIFMMNVLFVKINQTGLMLSLKNNIQNDNQDLKNTQKTPKFNKPLNIIISSKEY